MFGYQQVSWKNTLKTALGSCLDITWKIPKTALGSFLDISTDFFENTKDSLFFLVGVNIKQNQQRGNDE